LSAKQGSTLKELLAATEPLIEETLAAFELSQPDQLSVVTENLLAQEEIVKSQLNQGPIMNEQQLLGKISINLLEADTEQK